MPSQMIEGTVDIQKANLGHLVSLRCLWRKSLGQFGFSVEMFETLFFNLDTECLVLQSADEVIAFILFRRDGRNAEIIGLAVQQGSRRQRAGLHLVEACMEALKNAEVSSVFFHTQTDNVAAQRLFENYGFNREGLDGHYPSGHEALRYRWSAV